MRLAEEGTPHLSLVVADGQTAGRGRNERTWHTYPGVALAFSLVLRPNRDMQSFIPRFPGLGGLAVCDVLQTKYHLPAEIKWPNDVLVERRKLAGVLTESQWRGDQIQYVVLGIGINVARKSVPSQGALDFPATSVAAAYGEQVDRWLLLREVLEALITRLPQLDQDGFIADWEANLAMRGEMVQIMKDGIELEHGKLLGLTEAGYLKLKLGNGEEITIQCGDVKLRQVDRT